MYNLKKSDILVSNYLRMMHPEFSFKRTNKYFLEPFKKDPNRT